jgi:hypothetical protein
MSKLNRKEFKELLTEWHQNFINERFNTDFKEKLKYIKTQNLSNEKIEEFDVIYINANLSDEFDEVRLDEFRDPGSEIYSKINKFVQPEMGYDHDITYENTDSCRREILNYLLALKAVTQEEVSRANNLGKNKDIMIIFEVGDAETWHTNSGDNTYNNVAYNLHDAFHIIFDFNQVSRTQIMKDFMSTTEFEMHLQNKLSQEDYSTLIDYVNRKLSANQPSTYSQHNITQEDFFPSFMAFVYLYVFNNSNSHAIEELSRKDDYSNLFSDHETIKEIMLNCAQELKKYINNVNNDKNKYIYINCP